MKLLVTFSLCFFLIGCSQKSEVDKCVDAWEASVDFIPDDLQAKKNQRFEVRQECMRPGYTLSKSLQMDLDTIRGLCEKKAGTDKPLRTADGSTYYTPPGTSERLKAECELEYRLKQQEANNRFK